MISMLRAIGYDYVLSIEHEDMLGSIDEGLGKAIKLLRENMFKEQLAEMWWAYIVSFCVYFSPVHWDRSSFTKLPNFIEEN